MNSIRWNRRMRYFKTILFVSLWIVAGKTLSQEFGKNKVQYQDFDWKYLQSEHFDIYYYGNGTPLAEFVADAAESSYVAINRDFRFKIHQRIPILVYNSHNDFEQTNVSSYVVEETVGGFTEIFKDRIVIPFQGSYKDLRHVVHHELTHAVMFQMIYGGGAGSMVSSMARFQMPLWLAEGLAEYESLGWDSDSDMFMRDATINDYVPPISQMSGFMVYKGGQSLLNYIAEKYGGQKIGDVLGKIRTSRNVETALKQSMGFDLEELTKRWHKYLRKTYWPDIENRSEPEDVAKRLTDHIKEKCFLNNSPSLSPQGDKLVYLSSRSDYIDVYLMNTIDGRNIGRLVKGQRSNLFEELHWLRPGIGWSPDGKQIVFTAKAGDQDALLILDVKKRKIVEIQKFPVEGLFSPSWSPDGKQIAFMGMKAGQSDIYLFQLETKKLQKLTDDIFSDLDPTWSPKGDEIAFVSDRGEYTSPPDENFKIQNHDYSQFDLYTLNVQTGELIRHTADKASEKSPAFSPEGDKIAFVSDSNGINNIFILDRNNQTVYPITNLLTGVSQISWSREGSRLAFSSFYNGGYDIYLLTNPLEIAPGSIVLQKTAFLEKLENKKTSQEIKQQEVAATPSVKDYRNFVFGPEFQRGEVGVPKKVLKKEKFLEADQYKNQEGDYKAHKYKIRFSPDIVTGGAGYSQFYGLQGSTMIALSDILGNHQINIYTDLFYNISNSNFQLAYFYLPKRIDLGASIFHYAYRYYTYYTDGVYYYPGYLRDRMYGFTLFASRPFDRFRRLDFGLTGLGITRDYGAVDPYYYYYYGVTKLEDLGNLFRRYVLLFNLGYNTDTVIWGMTGPVNGGRSSFTATYSPSINQKYGLDFWTVRGDWRKYLRLKMDYVFTLRFAGGVSGGRQPQRFLLGGMMGWINYKYSEIPSNFWGNDLFYFSSFETPFRGGKYYDMIGTRFVLANLEFRFPLIRYLILGWPLPFGFQNIRGVVFLDIGSAWDNDKLFRPFSSNGMGPFRLHDLKAGYGFGARLNMGFFLIKYDLGWGTDLNTVQKPIHYFTLGAEF